MAMCKQQFIHQNNHPAVGEIDSYNWTQFVNVRIVWHLCSLWNWFKPILFHFSSRHTKLSRFVPKFCTKWSYAVGTLTPCGAFRLKLNWLRTLRSKMNSAAMSAGLRREVWQWTVVRHCLLQVDFFIVSFNDVVVVAIVVVVVGFQILKESL